MHDAHGRDSRDQVRRDARRDVLGLSERRLSDEDLNSADMDNDFLDGIDEAFQRLMKLDGNANRNGHPRGTSQEDRIVSEIVSRLNNLSVSKREEVLTFVRSISTEKVD
jgi:hypothetical protein